MKRLACLAVIAAVASCRSAAGAAPACAGGVFVAQSADPAVPSLLVLNDAGRVASMGSCAVKAQKGRRRWPVRAKLRGCDGAPANVTLRGRWTGGCDELVLALRGKRFRHDLPATRSRCGDGFVDVGRGELCEATSDCPSGGRCTDCRCEDADCIPGALEVQLGLNPLVVDSDGDGVEDGAEDLDADGLTSCDELARGTGPGDADSDDDGSLDGDEVALGTDPLDPVSRMLRPGEVVTATVTRPGELHRYSFQVDASRQVLIRAVDLTGSDGLCVYTYDVNGDLYGAPRCGDSVARVVRSFGAGLYTIAVVDGEGQGTGTYRLQYLPVQPDAATALPAGPDAFVDADLPRGLLHLYRFTLDAPRRVAIRASQRQPLPAFEPCVAVLNADGDQLPDTQDCDAANVARDLVLGAGSYYVLVNDQGDTADGPYRLRVLPLHPDYARELSAGPQCRALDGWGEDVDVYRIALPAPATVGFVLTRESSEPGFSPCLRLWHGSSLDSLYGAGECSGPVSVSFPLAAGTYYATIHDDLRTTPGSYCLAVE